MPTLWSKTRTTLEMIKWEHSIFALPFALTAVLLAANGLPGWRTLAWILLAMVSASIPVQVHASPQPAAFCSGEAFFGYAPANARISSPWRRRTRSPRTCP